MRSLGSVSWQVWRGPSPAKARARHGTSAQSKSRLAAAGILLVGFSLPALGSLGGTADSAHSDGIQMRASVKTMQYPNYSVQAMTLPGGTVVDEYLNSAGRVFAVAWHGPFPPPMQQILGEYFQQYSTALQSKPKVYGHHPLDIEQSGLVVETGGHMRAHFGRVYLSDQLPQGVTANQIQ